MIMLGGNPGDDLHRAVKLAIDSGEVATLEEAIALFKGYRLAVDVGRDVAQSPSLQAALLTTVNTGRRCFLGGVEVVGALDAELLVPWRRCRTLGEAVADLKGSVVGVPSPQIPCIRIGDGTADMNDRGFAVQATFHGWSGGASPIIRGVRLRERQECTPAGVLAGSIAVSEAFQFVRGGNATAGRRDVGLSLWRPESDVSWLAEEAIGPPLQLLPTKLWTVGLGHLGQAYLWTLGLLPYDDSSLLELVLQDFDTLIPANDSTSLLTTHDIVSHKKARAIAAWAEERGFRTAITERAFAANFRVAADEPLIALFGVDNADARAVLEDVGFTKVVDAGLGKGASEYLAFQVHTFPGPQQARELWGGSRENDVRPTSALTRLPAYAALAADGLDECGLALLAGRSVGASFVGAAVSTLVVAEVLRTLIGDRSYSLIDGTFRTLAHRAAVAEGEGAAGVWNPGYCLAHATRS